MTIKLPGGGRNDLVKYPKRAITEALINAFAHRDYLLKGCQIDFNLYQDRLEIISPGKFILPGNVQDYDILHIPSRRRNEMICRVFELCKLMESSGSGFEKIVTSYQFYDRKFSPKVYSDPSQFIITLYNLLYKDEKENIIPSYNLSFTSPRSGNRTYDNQILNFCLKTPRTRQEIQEFIKLKNRQNFMLSILNPLIDAELLLPTQEAINAPNQKYYTNTKKVISVLTKKES